jgi:hypothetical protein
MNGDYIELKNMEKKVIQQTEKHTLINKTKQMKTMEICLEVLIKSKDISFVLVATSHDAGLLVV